MNYVEFNLFPRSQLWSEYFCLIQLVAGADSQRKKNKPREHLVSDGYTFRSLLTASRIRQTEHSGHNNKGHQEMRGLYRGLELLKELKERLQISGTSEHAVPGAGDDRSVVAQWHKQLFLQMFLFSFPTCI